MKKMFLLLVAAFMMVTANVALADEELYITPGSPEMYYYNDPAVRGGYIQAQAPIQGVAINGALEYGKLGMSADFVALQVLPQVQIMGGSGNGGVMTHNTYKNTNMNINLDVIKFHTNSYGDEYNGYDYWSATIYNPNYNYYYGYYNYIFSGSGYGDSDFCWVGLDFSRSVNENSYLSVPLPSVLETSAMQASSNHIEFQFGAGKITMDQKAMQAGSLKVIGYGQSSNSQCN